MEIWYFFCLRENWACQVEGAIEEFWGFQAIYLQTELNFKGQLISKCLFGIFNFAKKRMKKFNLTNMVPQINLFLFVFWKN